MHIARLTAIILALLALGRCESREQGILDTTLCAIAAAPATFDGRTVRLRSRFESDGHHGSWLSDPSCGNPGIVVQMGAENARVRELLAAVVSEAEHPGTLDKNVTGTFTAVFRRKRWGRPARALELLDVTDVVIEPRADSPFATQEFIHRLARDLYLQPLGLVYALTRITADSPDHPAAPHGFVVHVHESRELGAPEILRIDVVRVRGHLQYVSASGPALDAPAATAPVLENRRAAAVRVIQELGGYSTDGIEHRASRAGFVELRFTHLDPPDHLSGTTTAVFDQRSGILVMFGTPAVPPGA